MSCSDELKNIDWNMPRIPCNDIGNMEKWKTYSESFNTWAKKEDVSRVFIQCLCQNGSKCFANGKCKDIFSNLDIALSDPVCMECIGQSPECRPFADGLTEYGIILKNINATPPNKGVVSQDLVKSLVKDVCNINVDSSLSKQIANVLNENHIIDTTNKNKPKEDKDKP